MCPACMATASLTVANAIPTGGVIALVVKKFFRAKSGVKKIPNIPREKEN